MCLIIHKPAGTPVPATLIEAAVRFNCDGWGSMGFTVSGHTTVARWRSTRAVDIQQFVDMRIDEELVLHLRYRTRGAADEHNLQPFEIVPGLSFADLAWARLGVDPLAGARVLDGRGLDPAALEAGGPVLFAQLDTALGLSDVKLALLDRVAPDHEVVLLHHLGRPDEHVARVLELSLKGGR